MTVLTDQPRCGHCGQRPAQRVRTGLCHRCHDDPEIRHRILTRERLRTRKPCRHCKAAQGNRQRGLCWRCYTTPAIRCRYPSLSKFATAEARGERPEMAKRQLPAQPTRHRPGSPEKVAVLEARAAQGVALWHPGDAAA